MDGTVLFRLMITVGRQTYEARRGGFALPDYLIVLLKVPAREDAVVTASDTQ
jgi:hypothetical protein